MATTVVIDENELVIESWGETTDYSTSWSEIAVQTSEDQS